MRTPRRSLPLRRTPAFRRTPAAAAALLLTAAALAGCSNKQRLGEYDFRSRTLAVTTIAPTRPEVFSALHLDVDESRPLESILRVSSGVAREVSLAKVRTRLDSAARGVDVADRMGDRLLRDASRHLRTTPVSDARTADYEIEVRVRRYGITASSWSSAAYFLVQADLILMDGATGRRIWKEDVRATERIQPIVFGRDADIVGGVVTALAVAQLSAADLQRALEGLSDFAADHLTRRLVDALDDARD